MHNGPNRAPCSGRNKSKCEKYRLLRRREWSHINRIKKHLAKYGQEDLVAIKALERYKVKLRS